MDTRDGRGIKHLGLALGTAPGWAAVVLGVIGLARFVSWSGGVTIALVIVVVFIALASVLAPALGLTIGTSTKRSHKKEEKVR